MRNQLGIVRLPLLVLSTALSFALAACGASNADATPTMSVDAIYTAAYQTLTVQHATQLALTPPTSTPSPLPSPTIPPPPTLDASAIAPFGTTTTSNGNTPGCLNSVYVSDVTIPDGTSLTPGFTFKKTWKIMNKGTCDWPTSYKLAFEEGDDMGGASVPLPSAVPVGQQVDVSVVLNAPLDLGDFYGIWMLQDDKGAFFGQKFSVVIKVRNPGAANTATPTP